MFRIKLKSVIYEDLPWVFTINVMSRTAASLHSIMVGHLRLNDSHSIEQCISFMIINYYNDK